MRSEQTNFFDDMQEELKMFTLFEALDHEPARFNGPVYEPEFDQARLTGQILRVYDTIKNGEWLTLDDIHTRIIRTCEKYDPQPSISAQLRHLRKARFGGYTIEKRPRGERGNGLWEYALNKETDLGGQDATV